MGKLLYFIINRIAICIYFVILQDSPERYNRVLKDEDIGVGFLDPFFWGGGDRRKI